VGVICDPKQEICRTDFFQGRKKRLHESVRQALNESHCIGQDDRPESMEFKPPHGRIKGREELVSTVALRLNKSIK
jgi:hypothetical protein